MTRGETTGYTLHSDMIPSLAHRIIPLLAGIVILLSGPGASAQSAGDPQPSAQQPPHPAILLGQRAATILHTRTVNPILVIVDSPEDYLDALALWSRDVFFPILIDDDTDRAAQNIARFIRAFEPADVVRWTPTNPGQGPIPERVEKAVASVWGVENEGALTQAIRNGGVPPGGVVLTSEAHGAWTAGAAFAAARALPIVWIDQRPADPNAIMPPERVRDFQTAITTRLDALGYSWNTLADDIDAIALCLRVPGRIRDESGDNESLRALTDLIGRHDTGRRWAWASWIFDDAAPSAYQAMCSLFLVPNSAWLFDGYEPGFAPPYALDRAAAGFIQNDWTTTFTPAQAGNRNAWRQRTRTGIDAGLIHVNSAGFADWFNLNKQRTYYSDIPTLVRPAIVNFIHSFSAQYPDRPTTIAGRFLHQGAFTYIGAMHEPTLGAFMPLEVFIARLALAMPIAAAARIDDADAWRIQIIGDPLFVLAQPRRRLDEPIIPEDAQNLNDILISQLRNADLAAGARTLAISARDDDLLRLAASALARFHDRETEATISPDQISSIARAALPVAALRTDADLFARLYLVLDQDARQRDDLRALLWQVLRPEITRADPDPLHIALLREHVRTHTIVQDARELREPLRRVHGEAAVADFYARLIDRTTNERVRNELSQDAP